jgi:D-glycero-alpha-D-manno-heptose-7-phosphate kinase
MEGKPGSLINSVAPIRICDNGGWTDTWFAGHGKIFNIAVTPMVEVQIEVFQRTDHEEQVIIHAENYGDQYSRRLGAEWQRHPLLEAAIECMPIPEDRTIKIHIYSEAPAGASTGTSASVTVALLGALDRLTPGSMTPHEIAYLAHEVETVRLNQQSGIQDQLCAAYGGINYIEMHDYPNATVAQLELEKTIEAELERRLVLFYLGKSHQSSQIHEMVIRKLENDGSNGRQIEALRKTAELARDAILCGDFDALGRSIIQNTEAQRDLHPGLISSDARRMIEIAQAHGAVGWKVNGAGGEGGSVTVLCGPRAAAKRAMIREIVQENPVFLHLPIRLSRNGVTTWENGDQGQGISD